MKLYKVSIDNNPGGWKSGSDPSVLVPANSEEDAIEKVRNGWIEKYDFENKCYNYKKGTTEFSYVRKDSHISATEIRFEGYDIHIKKPRQAKLDRIDKHQKRNEQED